MGSQNPANQHQAILDQSELAKVARYHVAAEAWMDLSAPCVEVAP